MGTHQLLTVLALCCLGFTIIAVIGGLKHHWAWYWLGGFAMVGFSYITGFSIGYHTAGIASALIALALGHTLRLVRRVEHSLVAMGLGLVAWFFVILVPRL